MLGRDSNPGWGLTQAHDHPRRLDYFAPGVTNVFVRPTWPEPGEGSIGKGGSCC
jgi:hypothetical protein